MVINRSRLGLSVGRISGLFRVRVLGFKGCTIIVILCNGVGESITDTLYTPQMLLLLGLVSGLYASQCEEDCSKLDPRFQRQCLLKCPAPSCVQSCQYIEEPRERYACIVKCPSQYCLNACADEDPRLKARCIQRCQNSQL
jgi:hypothetical protein